VAVLKSKISQIHQVEEGAAVGYDNGWIAQRQLQLHTPYRSRRWDWTSLWPHQQV